MPRAGVSFDQICSVADRLVGENITPTIRKVRELLGTGSDGTIHKHLSKWRDAHQQLATVTTELPVTVTKPLSLEIDRIKAEARAEAEQRLVLAQAEAQDLAESCDVLEADLEKQKEEISALTAVRDKLLSQVQEQSLEIDRLSKDVERERYGAEQARIETGQLRNKLETQTEKLSELSGTVDRLISENTAEALARSAAEKTAAVLEAKLQAELERSMTLVREKEAFFEQVAAERQSGEAARIASAQTTKEIEHLAGTLAAKESELRELSDFFETEKNARICAEMKIAALVTKLEEQGKSMDQLHNLFSEIATRIDIQIPDQGGSDHQANSEGGY